MAGGFPTTLIVGFDCCVLLSLTTILLRMFGYAAVNSQHCVVCLVFLFQVLAFSLLFCKFFG